MEAVKTIPEAIKDLTIVRIGISISDKIGSVEVIEDGNPKSYVADLTDEWASVSEANKLVIRTFFKKVVEICLSVEGTDITGDAL